MVSFSSLLTTLMDWSANLKERLSEACLTFLNVSPKSKVYRLCKDYPVLVVCQHSPSSRDCFILTDSTS